MEDIRVSDKLRRIIENELSDAALYKVLAKIAPNAYLMQMMLEIASQEAEHADTCMNIFKVMQGFRYVPKTIAEVSCSPDFAANLRLRIDIEIEQYRNYSYEYINSTYKLLREFYFKAQTDELIHSLKLLQIVKST